MKKLSVEKVLNKKSIENILKNENISKSQKIKELFNGGLSVKEISVNLGIRYNFAYNVISNFTRVNSIEVESSKPEISKKDLIVELFKQGKSNKEIQIELKTNYNYVFNVIKEYKLNNNDSKVVSE